MSKRLENIESHLQKMIEGAGKLFTTSSPTESFSEKIIRCMRDHSSPDPSGVMTAPTHYLVEVNPTESTNRVFDQSDLEHIISELTAAATANGILMAGKPEIIIRPNTGLKPGAVRISARRHVSKRGDTASVQILEEPADNAPAIPPGAFLIVNGAETVQLSKPVINIGRRTSNDIVLNDQRVSRNHAQLRSIKGSYVVFDLNSRGGTFVNNLPVNQKELAPGDVISLAGVPVIYGQDTGGTMHDEIEQTPTHQLLTGKSEGKK
jgi:hypothetical protein